MRQDEKTQLASNPWVRVFCLAIATVLLAAVALWFFIGRRASIQRLFQSPIADIQRIQVEPVSFRSLVDHRLVITNQATIRDIMLALRSAEAYSPSHPEPRWDCFLVVSDLRGKSYVELVNRLTPTSQGTIVYCATSERGFFYRTLKSATIGDILEKAVQDGTAR